MQALPVETAARRYSSLRHAALRACICKAGARRVLDLYAAKDQKENR